MLRLPHCGTGDTHLRLGCTMRHNHSMLHQQFPRFPRDKGNPVGCCHAGCCSLLRGQRGSFCLGVPHHRGRPGHQGGEWGTQLPWAGSKVVRSGPGGHQARLSRVSTSGGLGIAVSVGCGFGAEGCDGLAGGNGLGCDHGCEVVSQCGDHGLVMEVGHCVMGHRSCSFHCCVKCKSCGGVHRGGVVLQAHGRGQ